MKKGNEENREYEMLQRKERGMQVKVALIMVILTVMAFVLLLIFSDGARNVPSDEDFGGIDALTEKNGEITHPTENDATTGQESVSGANEGLFLMDEDGGYWVIEALLVPEEWKK